MRKTSYLLVGISIFILLTFQFYVFPSLSNGGMDTNEYLFRGIINAIRYTGLSIALILIAGILYLKDKDE